MMTKIFKRNKLIALLSTIFFVLSCVQDDDFDLPDTSPTGASIDGTLIDIEQLYRLWLQELLTNENETLTFNGSDQYVAGYVVSSDEAGNFFEELVVQNSASNPTRGMRVLVDASPLFTTYEFGRKVFIKLDGLTVSYTNVGLSLGVLDGTNITKISESQQQEFIIRDIEVATILPRPISLSEINYEVDENDLNSVTTALQYINQYIRVSEVQFNRNDAIGESRKTFAAEPTDEFDGERILESCNERVSVIFSTSTFADFKAVLLPEGRGTIDAVLALDFFGEQFNLVVNDPSSINLESSDRCDPMEVNCGLASSSGNILIFSEFFETQNTGDPVSGNGWTNYMEAGTAPWEVYSATGSNASLGNSARIGSFMSGDASNITWLVTPEINFDVADGETLEFRTSNSFSDGSQLELLFSADWDGVPDNIPSATWSIMSDAYIVQNEDFFGDWLSSGRVDLSCLTGSGHIAWRYTGSGNPDFDGTYELDEIEIRSN